MAAARRSIALLTLVSALLLTGAASAAAAVYSNATPILVRDNQTADPYPAEIGVSGLSGEITDLEVTLSGVTHTCLDDLGVVVQAPGGQTLLLMNGVGSVDACSTAAGAASNVDLTFDDAALTQLQDALVPVSGGYRPANHQPAGSSLDSFDPPGPGSSYGNPGPQLGGTATLASVFNGQQANGTWKLWVRDFAVTDSGEIARGWSLDVTTTGGGGDTTPPETQILSGPEGTIVQDAAEFTFSAGEPATFECALDLGAFAPCASPKSYTGLAEGSHTFEVRATDSAGNLDDSPATRTFTVDIADPPPPPPPPDPPSGGGDEQAPSVSIAKVSVKSPKRKATVAFSGSDDVSAASALVFTCKLDAKPAKPCTSPAAFKKLKPGRHRVEVRARDEAGNEGAPASRSFKVKKPAR